MWKGEVVGIFIRSVESHPTQEVDRVRAVPCRGLEGDYFYTQITDQASQLGSDQEITLIEIESLESVYREYDVALTMGESRRNIITRHVPLNNLVGKQFKIGEVTLQGIRLCEPCSHLAELTQKKVLPSLVHRGGLRAKILNEGTLQTGDPVLPIEHALD